MRQSENDIVSKFLVPLADIFTFMGRGDSLEPHLFLAGELPKAGIKNVHFYE